MGLKVGGASSCSEGGGLCWKAGDVLWGRVGSYPWWPMQVVPLELCHLINAPHARQEFKAVSASVRKKAKDQKKKAEQLFLVRFFGGGEYDFLTQSKTKAFKLEENDEMNKRSEDVCDHYVKQKDEESLAVFLKAIEEARHVLRKHTRDRGADTDSRPSKKAKLEEEEEEEEEIFDILDHITTENKASPKSSSTPAPAPPHPSKSKDDSNSNNNNTADRDVKTKDSKPKPRGGAGSTLAGRMMMAANMYNDLEEEAAREPYTGTSAYQYRPLRQHGSDRSSSPSSSSSSGNNVSKVLQVGVLPAHGVREDCPIGGYVEIEERRALQESTYKHMLECAEDQPKSVGVAIEKATRRKPPPPARGGGAAPLAEAARV